MKIEELAGDYRILSMDDEDFEIQVVDNFEYKDCKYIFAFPVDEPECEEIYIAQEHIQDGETEYIPVDDEDLLYILYEEFRKRNSEIFVFED